MHGGSAGWWQAVRISEMKTFEFTIILENLAEVTTDTANALFEAGCADGTFSSSEGQAQVQFDREAKTLEAAVESAIAQVRAAGLEVARVDSEEFATIHKLNQALANA
jgi:hypothetical protein